jgi:hypothetical protein
MRYVRCQRRHLEQRCHQRGYELGPALACIAFSGDGFIEVDTEHPAYPKGIRPAAPLSMADIVRAIEEAGCGCSPPTK